jgi:sec-independent protein translocase protein TatA
VDVGPAELLIILAVVLLLFGSKKLPGLARGLGEAAHEFRKALHHPDDESSARAATSERSESSRSPGASDREAGTPPSSK